MSDTVVTINDKVKLHNEKEKHGTVKFIGEINGQNGIFYGVTISNKNQADLYFKKNEITLVEKLNMLRVTVGDIVNIKKYKCRGIIRFIGETKFKPGIIWYGIQLEQPKGKNNGTIQRKKYFLCDPNHGIFVKASQIEPHDKKKKGKRHAKCQLLSFGYCRAVERQISWQNVPQTVMELIMLYGAKYQIIGIGQNSCGLLSLGGNNTLDFFAGIVGSSNTLDEWTRLVALENITTNYKNIYCNERSIMVINEHHSLYVAGNNSYNRLLCGDDMSEVNNFVEVNYKRITKPHEIVILTSRGVKNTFHTFIYTSNDKLYGNGTNAHGYLGSGYKENVNKMLVEVPRFWNANEKLKEIQCGYIFSLFLTDNNNVYFCGYEHPPEEKCILRPQLKHTNIKQISVGFTLSILLTEEGDLVIFGVNTEDQIGSLTGKPICDFFKNQKIKIKDIQSGSGHGMVLSVNNNVYTFGQNDAGQCGTGKINDLGELIIPPNLLSLESIFDTDEYTVQIACGFAHNLLLTNKNKIYSLGYNKYNQCSSIINKDCICSVHHLDKKSELKVDRKSYVEHVIALWTESLIIMNTNVF